ncbi:MAG: tetratricopeptide repeat protein [Opitutaceae bacterium]|nr:tetratricopeptide repeat protein [Opitutaceae bacterium]
MRLRHAIIFLLGFAIAAKAQESLNQPAPLVGEAAQGSVSAGGNALTLLAAQRAGELGFTSAAITLYQELLAQPRADQPALALALVTALMDDGRFAEAQTALDRIGGVRGAAWKLRAGLLAAQRRDWAAAEAAVAGMKPEELSAAERGWLWFLRGVLADAADDPGKARGFYEQAEGAAGSAVARARFVLAREQARLRLGAVDEPLVEEARKNMERLQGRKTGYSFARTYAVMLDALGRKAEAVAILQRQLLTLPSGEQTERDDFQMLLGLVAGAQAGPGRVAMLGLLSNGQDPAKQRAALRVLAGASMQEPLRGQFRRELDGLIAGAPMHPVLDDLLMTRAQLALVAKDYARAEGDARELLEKFPGSPRKAEAYGVLTASAWEQLRYRAAADFATNARDALGGSSVDLRGELGVLVAEAWFRARDYANAADAYSAVLREVPPGVPPGELMFQRILSDIEGGQLDTALQQMDALGADARFDAVSRWRTEWNLARALQRANRVGDAYARVNQLLGASHSARLPGELRARLRWLQARLSLLAGTPEETLRLVDEMQGAMPEDLAETLRQEVRSSIELLKAEALFKLGRTAQAVELMQKLRADYAKSDAAIYSIIIEAGYYAERDQAVEAQRLYTELADNYPDNQTYAPYALYQAALQAERRGQDSNLEEANKLIERMVTRYPQSQLVFYARLKQGDLWRKLNQFALAQQVYESLVNNYPSHPDAALAQLVLAECHNAQSVSDPSHAERAIVLFEQVRDRVDAPVDVRVEAGYNLGYLMLRRNQPARAEAVWWRDVVTAFLLDESAARGLGAKGRYWMTRTLLEAGSLYEQQAKYDRAREAWGLIIESGLPGAALARDRIARLSPANA